MFNYHNKTLQTFKIGIKEIQFRISVTSPEKYIYNAREVIAS